MVKIDPFPREHMDDAAVKLIKVYLEKRLENVNSNLLTFGRGYDSVCFDQGKVDAFRSVMRWLEKVQEDAE